ncbi:MAG: metalloregulator ArsR/SmtB family transcription factor [Brevefilum sp.]|nr:metalloregulator ArsR/SmtB family transcription factor [Brevefilum sp.]MDT8381533.1 metalloregulator ArsR/SmtB family transcription factor [Brevefilum sp.]MDW7754434.1 metalloregulator ArsR/SmtB family transcription factor [Brevefilum sp.]
MEGTFDELLAFFKALSDANRLRLVGLLAQKESSVEELAAMLDVSPSTVSHHLSKLSDIGLVSARAEGYYNIYSLNTGVLQDMSQRMLSKDTLPDVARDLDREAYDRKVMKDYLAEDGKIAQLPTNRRKLDVILRYLVEQFDFDRQYTEKEVNEIIGAFNEDISGLRRDLISVGFLDRERDRSAYWRVRRED